MNQKPANEIMYDIVSDLFRVIHGSVSMNKLDQLKRIGDTFSKGVRNVANEATIEIFERLQKRVHNSFLAMEKDIDTLDKKVDSTVKSVEERIAKYELQVAAVKKIAEDLREDLKKLDKMFKGIGQ